MWNPATWSCNSGKYLPSIADDSVITCDEIIEAEAKSYDKKQVSMKKYNLQDKKFLLSLTCLFINYPCITDSS